MDHRHRGDFRAPRLARAFEADDFLLAIQIGDAITRLHPGARVAVMVLVVIGPERTVFARAFRQWLADDLLDVFESEHLRTTIAPAKVRVQRRVFAHLVLLPHYIASGSPPQRY